MTKFYDNDCSFEHLTGCRFIKHYISMFEKWLSVTAMADGGEQMRMRMCVTSAWGQEYNRIKDLQMSVNRILQTTQEQHFPKYLTNDNAHNLYYSMKFTGSNRVTLHEQRTMTQTSSKHHKLVNMAELMNLSEINNPSFRETEAKYQLHHFSRDIFWSLIIQYTEIYWTILVSGININYKGL